MVAGVWRLIAVFPRISSRLFGPIEALHAMIYISSFCGYLPLHH